MKKILVIQVAALGWDFLQQQSRKLNLNWKKAETISPALTCSVQASFKTTKPSNAHGMVANGFFFESLQKPLFWEQNASLVEGKRFWKKAKEDGKRCGVLFWQQSLGNQADILLSPAPVHKHHGGMIQDCYSQPTDLYPKLKKSCGGFNLMHYWGPFTSDKSSKWIVKATQETMKLEKPDLLLTYLPHLDYELQKTGPDSAKSSKAYGVVEKMLGELLETAKQENYEVVIFGDYAIMPVSKVCFPNKILRAHKLMEFRQINKMLYPDYYNSKALAIVDHQVAHIKIFDKTKKMEIKALFEQCPEVDRVLDGDIPGEYGTGHKNCGDLVLISKPDAWFAYHWWEEKSEIPDYATHVDIHNKPGYDPCELFFGFPAPFATSLKCEKIMGSHGLAGKDYPIAWASTLEVETEINNITDLALAVKKTLES